jgi:small subunit ribosomal protein S3
MVGEIELREFLKKELYSAGVPTIEIAAQAGKIFIKIHCARPGKIIGKGGMDLENLRTKCKQMMGEPVQIDIVEVRAPNQNAQLVAEEIASCLERRMAFRRAMKQAMFNSTRAGARGIKTCVSGRLGGAEIARKEHYHEVPSAADPARRHRLRLCRGPYHLRPHRLKVWIYRGEILVDTKRPRRDDRDRGPVRIATEDPHDNRPPRTNTDRREGGKGNVDA